MPLLSSHAFSVVGESGSDYLQKICVDQELEVRVLAKEIKETPSFIQQTLRELRLSWYAGDENSKKLCTSWKIACALSIPTPSTPLPVAAPN